MRNALLLALVVAAVGAASGAAFAPARAGAPGFWAILLAVHAALVTIAFLRARYDGDTWGWIVPSWGDFTRGFFVALVLFGSAYFATRAIAPAGTPREGWLVRLYLQLGSPEDLRAHTGLVALAIVAMAFAEEVVWRGLVTTLLAELVGSRAAWVYAAGLYALAHVPTMWALRDGAAGPNPLLPLGALGCGLVLGAAARSFGRLVPGVVAHALFDWCLIMMFRLWGPSV